MYMRIAIIVWIFVRNDGGGLWNKGSILGAKTRSATKISPHLTSHYQTIYYLLSNYVPTAPIVFYFIKYFTIDNLITSCYNQYGDLYTPIQFH